MLASFFFQETVLLLQKGRSSYTQIGVFSRFVHQIWHQLFRIFWSDLNSSPPFLVLDYSFGSPTDVTFSSSVGNVISSSSSIIIPELRFETNVPTYYPTDTTQPTRERERESSAIFGTRGYDSFYLPLTFILYYRLDQNLSQYVLG